MKTCVLIPCYNEEATIGKVVADFRAQLPSAEIYVYDNKSKDRTAQLAEKAGATVRRSPRQGKGFVVRQMFAEIDADIYVLVDGDDTYPAQHVQELIAPIISGEADMTVGDRLSTTYNKENKRRFHSFGNKLVRFLINFLFRAKLTDIMSGYRVFSRKFVKNLPLVGGGFEIETQITLHALDRDFAIAEIPVEYRDRPEGSVSKLNTISDGMRIIKTIFTIFKDYKPLAFFGAFAILFLILSLVFGSFPILEYIETGFVFRMPLALLATGFAVLATLSLVCGLILDASLRQSHERYELRLLDFVSSEATSSGATSSEVTNK